MPSSRNRWAAPWFVPWFVRMSRALSQNEGHTGIIEVPDARAAINAIEKAKVGNIKGRVRK
jgi:hypothetical protein